VETATATRSKPAIARLRSGSLRSVVAGSQFDEFGDRAQPTERGTEGLFVRVREAG
jgi:hypothetical protein